MQDNHFHHGYPTTCAGNPCVVSMHNCRRNEAITFGPTSARRAMTALSLYTHHTTFNQAVSIFQPRLLLISTSLLLILAMIYPIQTSSSAVSCITHIQTLDNPGDIPEFRDWGLPFADLSSFSPLRDSQSPCFK